MVREINFSPAAKKKISPKKDGILNLLMHITHYEFNANMKTNWQAKMHSLSVEIN